MDKLEEIFDTGDTHSNTVTDYVDFGELAEFVKAVQENVRYFAIKYYIETKYNITSTKATDLMFKNIWQKMTKDKEYNLVEIEEFFSIFAGITQMIYEEMKND